MLPVLLSSRGSLSLPRTVLPSLKALRLLPQATHLHPNCWTWKTDATAGGLCARGAFLAGRGNSPSPPAMTLGFPPPRPQPCCAQRAAGIEPHCPPWSPPQGRRSPDPIPPAATVGCQSRLLQSQRIRTRPSTWRPQRTTKTCEETPDLPCGSGRPTSGGRGGSASGEGSQLCLPAFSRTVCLYRLTCLAEPLAKYWLSSQGPQGGTLGAKQPRSNLLWVPASFLE